MNTQAPVKESVTQAYINEYKGALFEYLVAISLLKNFSLSEIDFHKNLAPSLLARLRLYQKEVSRKEPDLYRRLPQMANDLSKTLAETIDPGLVTKIHLIGRLTATPESSQFKEADIVIESKNGDFFPIGIKLCKNKSYVNTKSGGMNSFIEKYFSRFKSAGRVQAEFNFLSLTSFNEMVDKLSCHIAPIDPENFSKEWTDRGLPSRPGDLSGPMHKVVLKHYQSIIQMLERSLRSLYQEDEEVFIESLLPLMGMGRDDLWQAKLFYTNTPSEKYSCFSSDIVHASDFKNELKALKSWPVIKNGEKSSFEIQLQDIKFQLRVKPMNSFLVPSYKINCSVKKKAKN